MGNILLKKYIATDVYTETENLDNVSFNDYCTLSILEILFAQPEVEENTDAKVLSQMKNEILIKTNNKSEEIYGTSKYAYFDAVEEITGETYSETVEDIVNDNSCSLLSVPEVSVIASSSDYNSGYYVKTPKGSSVPVLKLKTGKELTSTQKSKYDSYVTSTYSGASLISSATKKYNCHSYAWYSASTGNAYWMDSPSKYMSDGSYSKCSYKQNAKIYYKGKHSGIVTTVKVGMAGCYVKSKWGAMGLVSHFYTNCPYYSSSITINYWYKK